MNGDVPEHLRPRLCHIVKWPDFAGYGFNLHAEKGKAGQFIGQVDQGSPAEAGGLKEGDRIVEVNNINIGNENHQQVVTRIKSGGDETRLLVVDNETDNYYKEQKVVVKGDLEEVRFMSARRDEAPAEPEPEPEPVPEPDVQAFQETVTVADNGEVEPAPEEEPVPVVAAATTNGDALRNEDELHRPRLCHLKIWPHFQGYGFNLHAERDKPGQFIGLVDPGSPAEAAGLRVNDRIVEVNGVNVENQAHPEVIARIKAVPNETRLLVVDRETDAYYKERGVTAHSAMPQVDVIVAESSASNDDEAPAAAFVADSDADVAAAAVTELEDDAPKELEQEEEKDVEEPKEEEKEEEKLEENVVVEEEKVEVKEEEEVAVVAEAEVEPEPTIEEPVNGVSSAPEPEPAHVPEPEPEFAVAPTPAPAPAPTPAPPVVEGLELNLSVAEMKERLKQRKKQDPRAAKMTFEQKYKDFERM